MFIKRYQNDINLTLKDEIKDGFKNILFLFNTFASHRLIYLSQNRGARSEAKFKVLI